MLEMSTVVKREAGRLRNHCSTALRPKFGGGIAGDERVALFTSRL
jgi:hypothetical protein